MASRRPSTHDLGRGFEQVAAAHLVARGWVILDRNVRHRRKEIDLVIRRGDVVAFVEVKGRRGAGFGDPLEAITARKRREIEAVARWWIRARGHDGLRYRFDALAVRDDAPRGFRVEHVEDAWRIA